MYNIKEYVVEKRKTMETWPAGPVRRARQDSGEKSSGSFGSCKMVRSIGKNLPLYRLGFFSRHERGEAFWREVKKYSTSQLGLL